MATLKIGNINVEITANVFGFDFTDVFLASVATAYIGDKMRMIDHNKDGVYDDIIKRNDAVIDAIMKVRETK